MLGFYFSFHKKSITLNYIKMICENALLSLFPVYHKHNAAHRMHPFFIYVYIAISDSEFCLLNACFNGIIEEKIHFNIIFFSRIINLIVGL